MKSENAELESLKGELTKFFVSAQLGTVSQKSMEEIFYFNKDIFELERCLLELI